MKKKRKELSIENRISETRTLHRDGIQYAMLSYQNPQLAELANQLPAGTEVVIEIDPRDIGSIGVYNPLNNMWINVSAVHQEYANGLTLYKHKAIQAADFHSQKVDNLSLMKAKDFIRKLMADEIRNPVRRGRPIHA